MLDHVICCGVMLETPHNAVKPEKAVMMVCMNSGAVSLVMSHASSISKTAGPPSDVRSLKRAVRTRVFFSTLRMVPGDAVDGEIVGSDGDEDRSASMSLISSVLIFLMSSF